jgi:hypothetical protein
MMIYLEIDLIIIELGFDNFGAFQLIVFLTMYSLRIDEFESIV